MSLEFAETYGGYFFIPAVVISAGMAYMHRDTMYQWGTAAVVCAILFIVWLTSEDNTRLALSITSVVLAVLVTSFAGYIHYKRNELM